MANERARVDIADYRDTVAFEILMRGFTRPPIGCKYGEFADDERLDIRFGRFFVVDVGADVADVRIGEADDLARIARIGENFLITSKASIENDFAATAGASARRTAVKYSSVLERESRAS
jgi:hypothetical protein